MMCRRGGLGVGWERLLISHVVAPHDQFKIILQMQKTELIGLRLEIQQKTVNIFLLQKKKLNQKESNILDLFIVVTSY